MNGNWLFHIHRFIYVFKSKETHVSDLTCMRCVVALRVPHSSFYNAWTRKKVYLLLRERERLCSIIDLFNFFSYYFYSFKIYPLIYYFHPTINMHPCTPSTATLLRFLPASSSQSQHTQFILWIWSILLILFCAIACKCGEEQRFGVYFNRIWPLKHSCFPTMLLRFRFMGQRI